MPYNTPFNENKISNTTSKIQFIHQKSDLTSTNHLKIREKIDNKYNLYKPMISLDPTQSKLKLMSKFPLNSFFISNRS